MGVEEKSALSIYVGLSGGEITEESAAELKRILNRYRRRRSIRPVLIGVPRWGVDPPESSDYRVEIAYQLGRWQEDPTCPYSFSFGTVTDVMVQYARELFGGAAVNNGFSYLGMMDDDMIGSADIWKRLLAHDVDIVAPLAFMRGSPHYPVVFALRGGWDPMRPQFDQRSFAVLNYPKNQLFECDAVGFGAVLIKTEVLKKMGEPYFLNFGATGEDVAFCLKARKAGFRVFCDSSIILKHLGPRQWIGQDEFEMTNQEVHQFRRVSGDWTIEKARMNLPG